MYTSGVNELTIHSGTLIVPTSLNTPLIKNTVSGGSFTYRNFSNTTLMTINNSGAVTFAGEISTPLFNSATIGGSISDLAYLKHTPDDIQGGQTNKYYHLTSSESAKVQQLNNYTIGTVDNNGAIWPNIPVIKTDGIMEIGARLHFHGTNNSGVNYQSELYTTSNNNLILAAGSFNCSSVSASALRAPLLKNNAAGSFVYRNSADAALLTIDNSGNVLIAGTLTQNGGSNTITHSTSSQDPTLEEGVFVETTGEIHYEPDFVSSYERELTPPTYDDGNILTEATYETVTETTPKNPYENCICKVKRAHSLNKNIVGVLTSTNPVKFATHGDVLIKVISDTYNLGDILIPTIDGYGKKATSGEIYDSLFMMIPRAKITALITNIPNTVSAILL